MHEGLATAGDGSSSEVVVVHESNEAIKGVSDLGGDEEDLGDISEEAERVEDEHENAVGSEDGPGAKEDVEEDAANVVGGPGLLLFVVNKENESVEEHWGNAEGDDGANGEDTEINLVEDGLSNGEASGGDGEGEGELLESFSGHSSSLVHIRYGFVLN